MSALNTVTGLAALAGLETLEALLIQTPRSIQTPSQSVTTNTGAKTIPGVTIIPDCVLEERHRDVMEISQVPIETGAPISDHAFKRPAEVVMRLAWSASKSLVSLLTGKAFTTSLTDVYNQLLALQTATSAPPSLQPFTVVTGKRVYRNMLLKSLQVVTNQESENALMVEAMFQEVIIVTSQVQTASSLLSQSQPPMNTGGKQLQSMSATASSIIGGLV